MHYEFNLVSAAQWSLGSSRGRMQALWLLHCPALTCTDSSCRTALHEMVMIEAHTNPKDAELHNKGTQESLRFSTLKYMQ